MISDAIRLYSNILNRKSFCFFCFLIKQKKACTCSFLHPAGRFYILNVIRVQYIFHLGQINNELILQVTSSKESHKGEHKAEEAASRRTTIRPNQFLSRTLLGVRKENHSKSCGSGYDAGRPHSSGPELCRHIVL